MTHRPRYAIVLTIVGAALSGLGIGLIVYAGTVQRNARMADMTCGANSFTHSIESGQVEDLNDCPSPDNAGSG
jgi:hypothetical protein